MRKILIRGPDTVGSFVLATPFIRELRENHPTDYIVLCIKPLVYELAKNCPYVNKVLIYEKDRLKNFIKLKKEKFDTVFLLSGSFESALFCYLLGVKNRIGYPHDHRGFLLTQRIFEKEKKHYVDYILYILESLNYKITNRGPEIFIKDETNNYDFLFRDKIPVVGITYASIANDARKWPKEYVLDLSKKLVAKGFKVVLLGKTKDDINFFDDNIINLVNKTNLLEFVSIVKKLYTYISVATGGIHIAGALGVRTIGLYIPGDEFGWSPYSKNSIVISKNVFCSPCNPHKMKYCKNNICMKKILPEDILKFF
jgi:ADP-heptose:LPS heptosyltransferase